MPEAKSPMAQQASKKKQGSPHTAAPVDAPSMLLVNDRTDSSDPDMDKRIGAALRPALFAQRDKGRYIRCRYPSITRLVTLQQRSKTKQGLQAKRRADSRFQQHLGAAKRDKQRVDH